MKQLGRMPLLTLILATTDGVSAPKVENPDVVAAQAVVSNICTQGPFIRAITDIQASAPFVNPGARMDR
jgi:hypothetical protein